MAARLRKRKLCQSYGSLPLGPRTLEEVLTVQLGNVEKLIAAADDDQKIVLRDTVAAKCSMGVVTTDLYAGVGSWSCVTSQVVSHAAKVLQLPEPRFVAFAALECDPTAHMVLKAHPDCCRPKHLCPNILHRLPEYHRRQLVAMLTSTLQQWKNHKKTSRDPARLQKTRRCLSRKLVCDLRRHLEEVEFMTVGPCLLHPGKMCPLTPRMDPDVQHMWWVEGDGLICKAFSNLGSQDGFLHESILPCLVAIYSARFYEPDQLFTECVPSLNYWTIPEILNRDTPSQLNCVHALVDGVAMGG